MRQEASLLLLLAALPALAHAPAWWEGRLLGPGDGAALHFPLKAAVWDAYQRGEVPSWNPSIFTGTPLLASYRPGAFYPLMVAVSPLPPFTAFQVLVLVSLGLAGPFAYLYLRRLRAEKVGAFVGALSFCLGPYLAGHVADTATLIAAPLLPLLMMAAESHLDRGTAVRAAGLAATLALLLLAGSPEATRAGAALLAGRLLVGHLLLRGPRTPALRSTAMALLAGLLLAAPQIVPSLFLAAEAGRGATGLAPAGDPPLPGAFGLVLRYTSHTPMAALALAALPLTLTQMPVRVLGIALAISLALQFGRGPLAAPGALSLVFDFTLCVLGGLSLSGQWRARREPQGRRLRAYFLVASLASAAGLSVAAAALGPLPQTLAGPVGVLALSLILYFSLASSPSPVRAALWLLPLTVSFLLQPYGRRVWESAPRREDIYRGTGTREAVERAMGQLREERVLTAVRAWPREALTELMYGNLAGVVGRRSLNGYDPYTPARNREALGVGAGGDLPGAFFRSDPTRLQLFGVRWVQLPVPGLGPGGLDVPGDPIDLPVPPARRRSFPLPFSTASEVRIVSFLSEGVTVPQGATVAQVHVRLASGREFVLPLLAGVHTAEWAWDRDDVQAVVAHQQAPVFESWPGPRAGFMGHRYLGILRLPGRYQIAGLDVERAPGPGQLLLSRLSAYDVLTGRTTPVSLPSAYVSDSGLFQERVSTPALRLYEVKAADRARVVGRLKVLPSDAAVLAVLENPTRAGLDVHGEAVALSADLGSLQLPAGARPGRASVLSARGGHLDVRGEGPGLLVATDAWDPGWSAEVDGTPAPIVRVNHIQMGVAVGPGLRRVVFRHRARGLSAGVLLSFLGFGLLAVAAWRQRARGGSARRVAPGV